MHLSLGSLQLLHWNFEGEQEEESLGLLFSFWHSKEDCMARQCAWEPGYVKRGFSKFFLIHQHLRLVNFILVFYKMGFPRAQKGETKNKIKSHPFKLWGILGNERQRNGRPVKGRQRNRTIRMNLDYPSQGVVPHKTTSPGFLSDSIGASIGNISRKLVSTSNYQEVLKNYNKVCQAHWVKWISGL